MDVHVELYTSEQADEWDRFVRHAKNGTFLFERAYMEYHEDRFADCSFVARDSKGILAVLPASLHGDKLVSHGGLSFGGWITDARMRARTMLDLMNGLVEIAPASRIIYKAIPSIYHRQPAEEDLYALTRIGAKLIRRDIGSAIKLQDRFPYSSSRTKNIKRAIKAGIEVRECDDFVAFHAILESVLGRHGVKPVHSVSEMELLKARFADRIRLFGAFRGAKMHGGVLCFDNGYVVHTQNIACLDEGRIVGALDLLIDILISDLFKGREYFSFGISTEDEGSYLNEGLMFQKEGFGGRGVAYDFYEIDTASRIKFS